MWRCHVSNVSTRLLCTFMCRVPRQKLAEQHAASMEGSRSHVSVCVCGNHRAYGIRGEGRNDQVVVRVRRHEWKGVCVHACVCVHARVRECECLVATTGGHIRGLSLWHVLVVVAFGGYSFYTVSAAETRCWWWGKEREQSRRRGKTRFSGFGRLLFVN